MEEVHLPAEFAVIALLGLFKPREMFGQLLFVGPGRAVDALQLCVLLIAAPVCAGKLHQLERLAEPARRRQVRPAAKVLPVLALTIHRDRFAGRDDVVDDLRLERLADRIEVLDRLFAVPHFAHDRQVGVDDLSHALFDLGEIVCRKRLIAREVVVEAILDRGSDRHLRAGEEFLHRLRKHMRGVMAQYFEPVSAIARD